MELSFEGFGERFLPYKGANVVDRDLPPLQVGA